MGQRGYLRELTHLSRPLVAAIAFSALAAVVWAVAVALSLIWDVDVDIAGPVLGALIVAAVISAGVELRRHRTRWVRGVGALMITGALLVVAAVALIVWYASALCGVGCN